MSLEQDFSEVGKRVLELRGGLTQAEFAARLGVDRKTVVGWEAGKRLPDGASLLKLMTEFSANVNYILTGQAKSGVSLSAEEALMLECFQDASKELRRAAMGVLLSGSAGSGQSYVGNGGLQIGAVSGGKVRVGKK